MTSVNVLIGWGLSSQHFYRIWRAVWRGGIGPHEGVRRHVRYDVDRQCRQRGRPDANVLVPLAGRVPELGVEPDGRVVDGKEVSVDQIGADAGMRLAKDVCPAGRELQHEPLLRLDAADRAREP